MTLSNIVFRTSKAAPIVYEKAPSWRCRNAPPLDSVVSRRECNSSLKVKYANLSEVDARRRMYRCAVDSRCVGLFRVKRTQDRDQGNRDGRIIADTASNLGASEPRHVRFSEAAAGI
jgi:hypothetical protein